MRTVTKKIETLEDAYKFLGVNPKRDNMAKIHEKVKDMLAKTDPSESVLANVGDKAKKYREVIEAYKIIENNFRKNLEGQFTAERPVNKTKPTGRHNEPEEEPTKRKKETPHSILGVSPEATPEEIKKAYKKLARQYHPDFQTNADAATKKQAATMFNKINEAFEKLDRKKQLENEEVRTFNSAARAKGLNRQTPLEPQRTSPSAATQLAALPPAQEAPAVQQGNKPSIGAIASYLAVTAGAAAGWLQHSSQLKKLGDLGGRAMEKDFLENGHYFLTEGKIGTLQDVMGWMRKANEAGAGGSTLAETASNVSRLAANNDFLSYLGPAAAAASAGQAMVGLIKDVAAISKGEKVDAWQLAGSGVKVLRTVACFAGMTNPMVTTGLLAAQGFFHYSDPKTLQKLQDAQKSIEANQQKQNPKGWGKTLSDVHWLQTAAQVTLAETLQRTGAKVKEMVETGMDAARATLPSGQNNRAQELPGGAKEQFELPAGNAPLPPTPVNQIKDFQRPSLEPSQSPSLSMEQQFMLVAAAHQRG
jgi:hypothetical protein